MVIAGATVAIAVHCGAHYGGCGCLGGGLAAATTAVLQLHGRGGNAAVLERSGDKGGVTRCGGGGNGGAEVRRLGDDGGMARW